MLDTKTIKKINDFVYTKPRTIQEIAHLIRKNWRTANNYVDKIAKESGAISVRTFRGGTRGALKIVYWSRAGLGILSALICALLRLDNFISGLSFGILFYILTYYILKRQFATQVEKPSKVRLMRVNVRICFPESQEYNLL